MLAALAAVFIGWPAIIASLAAAAVGLVRRRPVWLYAGAVLATGISWYLSATPRFRGWALLLPLLHVAAGLLVRRRAWLLLVPFTALMIWLGWAVLTQPGAQSGALAQPRPPALTVLAGAAVVPVLQGSYCWKEGNRGVCGDTPAPPELVQYMGTVPAVVTAGAPVQLRFARPPEPGSLGANHWVNGQPQPVPLDAGGRLPAPAAPGVYVYDVSARWPQGSASYVFVIEVR